MRSEGVASSKSCRYMNMQEKMETGYTAVLKYDKEVSVIRKIIEELQGGNFK